MGISPEQRSSRSAAEKILVVGPAWVGDMVLAQCLFRQLKHDNSAAVIDVVAPSWSGPLLARMPEVRRAISLNVAHGELGLSKRYAVAKELRAESYDRAIVLPRSFKAAIVPFLAGIPRRSGFRAELRYGLINDIRNLDRQRLMQTAERFVALGLAPDMDLPALMPPVLRVDVANRERLAGQLGIDVKAGAVALMPGAAFGPAKCWPVEYYAKLANELVANGQQVWVLGSADERAVGAAVAVGNPQIRNLCGETRLEDTVDLLSAARVTVTNDSGLMHVAAAVGSYVIAIYGSTPPELASPLTESRVILFLNIECSPCRQRECPLKHMRCMRDILPESVFADVQAALA